MDPLRFDRLTRLFGETSGRRPLLRVLLGVALGGGAVEAEARHRAHRKTRDRAAGKGHERDHDLQAAAHGKKQGRKKKQKHHGGSPGGPGSEGCCGTKSCAAPKAGALRDGCDYAGKNFAGADLRGAQFARIDGRDARFTGADLRGAHFGSACLQGASFRRVRLDGALFGDACLFGADFTGADVDAASAVFAGGRFCDTTMPDGSVNDRDCGTETACCRQEAEPAPSCQTGSDCPDEACRTAACTNGQCVYTVVADGPSPNDECGNGSSGHCCEGDCCAPGATACNPLGLCCQPNCAGRDCGPDGCGDGTCGSCGDGQSCDAESGQCLCDGESCPHGCCANGPGNPGACRPGTTIQNCGTGGAACATCAAGAGCRNQQCVSCTPACEPGLRCNANGQCICDDQSCPDGCCYPNSGPPAICLTGKGDAFCGSGGETCIDCGSARCIGQVCVCLAGVCAGCCEHGPGNPGRCLANTPPVCGVGGAQCTTCPTGDGRTCNAQGECVCTEQSCPNGCCSAGAGNPGICVESQCAQDADCPNVRDCVCNRAQGTCCARNCDGKVCGPDGCGGDCENLCPPNTTCSPDGTQCLCTAQSCATGCCSKGVGNPGTCEPGNTNQNCGRPGQSCGTCTGQEQCQNGQCVCVPKTCAELGRTCGTAPDGCGGTLSCGVCGGATPSCNNGTCATCAATCGGCFCLNLTNGDTKCGSDLGVSCGQGCSSNANCTNPQAPLCAVSFGDDSGTTTFADQCGGVNPGVINVCTSFDPCPS